MKKLLLYCFFTIIGLLISLNQANAGCFPPFVYQVNPAPGGILSGKQIGITFITNLNCGGILNGNIRVYKSSNDSLIDTINVQDTVSGTYNVNYIINAPLECNTQYYIAVDSGSYSDDGYIFDTLSYAHSNRFVWNFTEGVTPVTFSNPPSTYFCAGGTAALSINAYSTYLWSNGATTQSITVDHPDTYSVTVTNANGCSATGNKIISALNPAAAPICMVTVDSLSQNNIIIWNKTHPTPIQSFIVYREITANNYQPIGEVADAGALSMFVDTVRSLYFPNTGDPNEGTYRYKLQVKDTCGNFSLLSPYHNTIYINNNNGTFSWVQLYNIEGSGNPVTSYNLMRDDYSNGNWHIVASVAGTQQTISDANYNNFKSSARWRVETQWGISCTPTMRVNSAFGVSVSNAVKEPLGLQDGEAGKMISIYPNPATNRLTIHASSALSNEAVTVLIFNVLGEVMQEENLRLSHETIINISELPAGIYFLQTKSRNGSVVKKFVKE